MLTNEEMRTIMQQYSTYLAQLSYMYVKNWAEAEDIVQEAFISYFKNPHVFEQKASLKTYLSKITIHKSIDHIRSIKTKAKYMKKLLYQSPTQIEAIDELLLSRIANTEIYRHVLTLKIKYREVIVLYYFENMTSVEISVVLGLPEATIRTRLKRGREQLKLIMEEKELEVFQLD
jgi:RNA polymerase sigma factor (sigma-70 family)